MKWTGSALKGSSISWENGMRGYRVRYTVQDNGNYDMKVSTDAFWADTWTLKGDIGYRVPQGKSFPESGDSVPGVYTPFPKWSDPKLWGPEAEQAQ